MSWLTRLAFFFLGHALRERVVDGAKRQGLLAYLKALRGVRRALMIITLLSVGVHVMTLAGFGAIVTGFLLWDYDYQTKIEILFGVFLALFALPFGTLVYLLSQRTWLKLAGVRK